MLIVTQPEGIAIVTSDDRPRERLMGQRDRIVRCVIRHQYRAYRHALVENLDTGLGVEHNTGIGQSQHAGPGCGPGGQNDFVVSGGADRRCQCG